MTGKIKRPRQFSLYLNMTDKTQIGSQLAMLGQILNREGGTVKLGDGEDIVDDDNKVIGFWKIRRGSNKER